MHGPSKDASLDQEGATAICWGGYLPSSADVGATAAYRRAYRYPHEYLCPTSTVLYRFGGGVELPATQRPASRAFMGPWTGWLAGLAGRAAVRQVCIILGLARRRPARADGPVSPASLTRCPALLGASGPVVSHRHLSLLTILPSSPEQFSSRLRHTSTRSWSSADIISARRSAPGRGAGDGMKTCRPSHGKRSYFPYPLHPPPVPNPHSPRGPPRKIPLPLLSAPNIMSLQRPPRFSAPRREFRAWRDGMRAVPARLRVLTHHQHRRDSRGVLVGFPCSVPLALLHTPPRAIARASRWWWRVIVCWQSWHQRAVSAQHEESPTYTWCVQQQALPSVPKMLRLLSSSQVK